METVSTQPITWSQETKTREKRDVWTALKRGFQGRCPRCGKGRLFRAFLKVDNACSVCGLDFTPDRADDRDRIFAADCAPARGLFAADIGSLPHSAATGQGCRGGPAMGAANAW